MCTSSTVQPGESKQRSRRNFLKNLSISVLLAGGAGYFWAIMKFFMPHNLYEPPSIFKLGRPEDFPEESITFLPDHNVFLFYNNSKIGVISSKCTHLGCNLYLNEEKERFECPCHGSKFKLNGEVLSGAAHRPLDWYHVALSDNREIIINKSKKLSSAHEIEV